MSGENALAQRGQVEEILRDFPSNATERETLIEESLRLSKDEYASLDMSEKSFFHFRQEKDSIQRLEDQMEEINNKLQANKEQLEKTQKEEKDFYGIPILSNGVRIRAHQTLQKSKEKALKELVEKVEYIYIMNERLIDPPKNQTMDGKEKGVTIHEISRKTIGDLLRDGLLDNDKQAMDAADEAYKRAKQAETEERLASAQGDQKWKEAREKKVLAYEELVEAERELRDLYKSLLVNELYSKGEQFHPIIEDLQEKKAEADEKLLKEIDKGNLTIETIVSKGKARKKLIWAKLCRMTFKSIMLIY